MNKLRRPTLWLAIVFAAGIMLMPQRGAAKVINDPFKDPPMIGDPDTGGDIHVKRGPSFIDRDWLPYSITTYLLARFGISLPSAAPTVSRMRPPSND